MNDVYKLWITLIKLGKINFSYIVNLGDKNKLINLKIYHVLEVLICTHMPSLG